MSRSISDDMGQPLTESRPLHGTPILLLHGMFGRPQDWAAVDSAFRNERPVFVPRLPVFDFPSGKSGLDVLVDRVGQIIDQIGTEKVILGGNSLGGHVATLAALNFPKKVAGLILTGSSGLFERGLDQGFERGVPRKPGREWIHARIREVFFDPVHITDELIAEVSETISHPRTVLNIIRLARAVRRSNLRDHLKKIDCPVTLIWGREDQITPPEVGADFNALLPDSELYLIDRCGHTPPIERPEEFNGIMRHSIERMTA